MIDVDYNNFRAYNWAHIEKDLKKFGSIALNVILSKNGEVYEITWIDISKIRKHKYLNAYWVSDDWSDITKYPPALYESYTKKNKTTHSTIWVLK